MDYAGLTFSILDEQDISPALDQAIRDGLKVCFPADAEAFGRQRWWHSRPAWTVLATDAAGAVIAHTAMIHRRVLVGPAAAVHVGGVQSFFVRPSHRGSGLSDRLMALTLEESRRRGLDAGLLFCLPNLEKVYARMGWRTLAADVFMRDGGGKTPIPGKNIAMAYPLGKPVFPDGDIDLAGQDW